MRMYIFQIKRTHNVGKKKSKNVVVSVLSNSFFGAFNRLKTAKCRKIMFIREVYYKLWESNLNELENLKYDTRQVRS